MTSIFPVLPLMVVFNLDNILLQRNLESEIALPFTKLRNGKVVDCWDVTVEYYPEVPVIFDALKNANIEIAVIYYFEANKTANELISLFGWDKYISFKAVFYINEEKWQYLKDIRTISKVDFDEMIFFDYERENVRLALLNLGVFSVEVHKRRGMTMKILKDAIKKYVERRKIKLKMINRKKNV